MTFWQAVGAWFAWNVVGPILGFLLVIVAIIMFAFVSYWIGLWIESRKVKRNTPPTSSWVK